MTSPNRSRTFVSGAAAHKGDRWQPSVAMLSRASALAPVLGVAQAVIYNLLIWRALRLHSSVAGGPSVAQLWWPHLIASVALAVVIGGVYSALGRRWIAVLEQRQGAQDVAARALASSTVLVPLIAAFSYLVLLQPWAFPLGTLRTLDYFFAITMALGGYGVFVGRWAYRSMVRRLPVSER